MPMGFVALAVATLLVASLNLQWIPPSEGRIVALALIAFVFPLQLSTSIFGLLARDGVAGTAMAILAGTWLTTGLVMLTSPPGATSQALGILFVISAVALAWPAIGASMGKIGVAVVLFGTVTRFATAGVYQLTGDGAWAVVTGWIGVALGMFALYAALALLLEGVAKRPVLPMGRRGMGRMAAEGGLGAQIIDLTHEPGVRQQL
jgi:succinate-acetate transporter protein